MSEKVDYNVAEWDQLKLAPLAAGMYLIAVSPSGPRGQSLEVAALVGAVAESLQRVKPGTLLSAIQAEIVAEASNPQVRAVYKAQLETAAGNGSLLQIVQQADALISSKGTPDETSGYRSLLMDVAHGVASAAKEGTFLGVGGKVISQSEQAALDELAAMLR